MIEKIPALVSAGLVVLAAMAPLLMPWGYWWGLVALLAAGSVQRLGDASSLTGVPDRYRASRLLCGALLLYAVAEALAAHQYDGWAVAWPVVAAGVLATLVWWVGRRLVLPAAWVWAGFAVAGVGTGVWSLWQALVGGVARAHGHAPLHAIIFGNLALLSGLLCVAGLGWVWHQRTLGQASLRWWLLLLAGACGGVLASLLSGTRGGWIALPLALLVFYRGYICHWPVRWRWSVLVAMVALVAGLYGFPQIGVQARTDAAVAEAQDYLAGEARGSVGMRLEMYRGAGLLILAQPWQGVGHQGYQPAMQALVEEERLPPGLGRYWHAHNELLDAWVRRGVLGLIAVLALYVVPLGLFSRRLGHANLGRRAVAVGGLLIPVAFIDFGITYAFFAYPVGVAVYASWLLLLWQCELSIKM